MARPGVRLIVPCLFIASLYASMGLWVRAHRMGPDWPHFLAAAHILAFGHYPGATSDGSVPDIDRLHVYSLRAHAAIGDIVLPHGPVAVLLMAPFVRLTIGLGLEKSFVAMSVLPWLPFLLFDILAAVELMWAVRRLRPRLGEGAQLFVFTLYLTAWATFFTSPYHAHFESILVFFILAAVRLHAQERDVLAGILMGLAYLTKPTAALAILAQAAIFLAARQGWRAAKLLALSVGTTLAVLSPFLIADTDNVLYMIFRAPQELPIAYMSIWYAFFAKGAQPELVVRWINLIGLLVAAALAGWFAWRRRIEPGSAANYGLIALVSIAALSLVKWGSLHYYLMPFAILLVWDLAANVFPWLSITYVGVLSNIFILWLSKESNPMPGMQAAFNVVPPGTDFGWQTAWVMIALFAGTLAWLGWRLGREAPAD